jgi:glycosyltransferase involved in cell wall biosynthesis
MARELSILFFGTQMAIGGAQKLLLEQARWFHARGHQVTAAFFYDKQGLHQAWQEYLPFPLLTLSKIGPGGDLIGRAIGLIVGLFRLWSLLRRGHFDVVESFTYDSNLLALPLAWLAGVPVRIATHHGMIEGFPRWIERIHAGITNAGVASILISVSNKTLEQAVQAGIKPERMVVIPNGISTMGGSADDRSETRREFGLMGGDVFLLSVGRLVFQKGHEFLVRATPSLLAAYPRVKVAICGEGTLRPQLEAQIAEMQLRESVRLLGNRNDIDRFLKSADIFVLPSRWEGLPVALLEAMAAGLPVVATQVEGVEEVVQNDIQGLLVHPEDSEALAGALLELIGNAGRRQQMGEAGKLRIQESYTIDIMCERYLNVMLNLLGPQATRVTDRQPVDKP